MTASASIAARGRWRFLCRASSLRPLIEPAVDEEATVPGFDEVHRAGDLARGAEELDGSHLA